MDDFTKEPGQDETPKEPSLGRFSVTPSNGKKVPPPKRSDQTKSSTSAESVESSAPVSRRAARRAESAKEPALENSENPKRSEKPNKSEEPKRSAKLRKSERSSKSEKSEKSEKDVASAGPLNWIIGVAAGIVTVALVGGAFAFGYIGTGEEPKPEIPVETTQPPREGPENVSAPIDLKTCSITPELADANLGQVHLYVIDNDTQKVVRDYEGDFAVYGGNITRVATAASALLTLGKDFQIETRVYLGKDPGTLVVKGYGDITLTRLSSGSSVYPSSARIADLVNSALSAYQSDPDRAVEPITEIYFDSSYFSGDNWNSKWDAALRSNGYLSRITALQLDGDRSNPKTAKNVRGNDPVAVFISYFEESYKASAPEEFLETPPNFTSQTVNEVGDLLATVKSAKYSSLLPVAVTNVDYTLTEALGRIVAAVASGVGSQAELSSRVPGPLGGLGINLSRFSMADASGLSTDNRVGANFLAEFSKQIYENKDLVLIHNIMPTSGQPGALSGRLNSGGLKDKVRAFVGAGSGASSLAGYVIAEDGTQLHFGLIISGTSTASIAAMDAIVAKLYKCGANLSNR
ncbi:MAG: D-alanyl-D-alanine carboxypeptidase [Microbacteriaceae bacterium]|nr:D-alanyl-D-alanine carboxypeptidase [Microbacteriaceae bacterium]